MDLHLVADCGLVVCLVSALLWTAAQQREIHCLRLWILRITSDYQSSYERLAANEEAFYAKERNGQTHAQPARTGSESP